MTKSDESLAHEAGSGFESTKFFLGNTSPSFDMIFKGFVALAILSIAGAFISQLIGGIAGGGTDIVCLKNTCGEVQNGVRTVGFAIPKLCGKCPAGTINAGMDVRNNLIQCACH